MGVYIIPNPKNFLALSGGTVSGDTYFSQNLSAATYFSGSTPLETTIYNIASTFALTFSAGTNLYVVSSSTYPHITYGLNNSINIPGTVYGNIISGTTFVSGGTNLQDIFVLSGTNLGGGVNVFEQKLNNNLLFNTILGSGQTTASKVGNNVVLYTPATIIPSSAYIWTTTTSSGSYRVTNWTGDSISRGTIVAAQNSFIGYRSNYSGLFVGRYNAITRYSDLSLILGGFRNTISSSYYGTIIGGIQNQLGQYYGSPSNYQKHSFIIGGSGNKLYNGYYSGIIGGSGNIITGDTYSADNGVYSSFIFGSASSKISGALHSFIIGGHSNLINHSATHTTIIGGQFITANTANILITPNLRLSSLSNPTGTSPYSLFADSNGYVFKKNFVGTGGIFVNNSVSAVTFSYTGNTYGGINNGINTFTGGTALAQTVNVTALTINNITVSGISNFNTLSATTVSAGTINSGSTNLYDIFITQGSINSGSHVVNGINTFTAGTNSAQSVNVTALTINNINVSGISLFNSITATTFYSGSTNLNDLLTGGTNYWRTDLNSNLYSTLVLSPNILSSNSFVAHGSSINLSYSDRAFIGNGLGIYAYKAKYGVILNGNSNVMGSSSVPGYSTYGFIGNGKVNRLYSKYGFIGNGKANHIYNGAYFSSVINGNGNYIHINTTYSSIINGLSNKSHGAFNSILNGFFNITNNYTNYSSIINGKNNIIGDSSILSTILNGSNNKINANITASTIAAGSNITADTSNTLYAPNLKLINSGTAQSFYAVSLTGDTIYSGGTELSLLIPEQTFLQHGISTYTGGTPSRPTVNVTALTINTITASGSSNFNTLSATTFSAGTINSGSTNLYNIFALPSQISTNNNGINTFTAGTSSFQSINVTGLSINNISVSGNSNFNTLSATTFSAGTINSGSTNLYDIFSTLGTSGESNTASNLSGGVGLFSTKTGVDLRFRSLSGGSGIGITQETNTVTIAYTGTSSSGGGNVINGINTFTAGTPSAQSVNVTALTINTITASGSSNFNTLSATTFSAGTINSGSTNLYDIFALPSQISTNSNGINTFTGGSSTFQSINVTGLSINNITVSGSSSFQSLSAVTLYSGSTDISLLIPAQTLVQNGINTFTGGTSARPTVNVTALTINDISVSGSSNFNTLSANTLSGATIYSGSTNLNSLLGEVNTASNLGTTGNGIFAQKSGADLQFKSLSAGTGINILTSTTIVTIAVNDIDSYLNLSGGTVTGTTNFNSGLSANTLSGGTIYSGSTPLQNIFVVSGQNLSTSGTSVFVNKIGSDLNFRTLSGSSGTSLSVTNNVITITSPNIPSGAYLFIPSSGYRSIVQANGGNSALGRFSFAVGTGNSANANYSVSLNGKSNTVGSVYGSSIGGRNNIDSSNFNGLILTSSGASIDDSSISYNTVVGSKNIKIFANKSGLESKYALVGNSNNSKLYQNNFGIILGSYIAQIGYLNVAKPKTHYSNIINSTNSKIYSNFSSILNSKNSFIIDKQSSGSSIISSYSTTQAFIRYSRRSSLIFSKESYIDANAYFKNSSYNSHIIGSDSSNTYNSQNSLILISRGSSVGYKTSIKQFFAGTLIAADSVINKSEAFGFAINSKTAVIDFKAKYSGLINSSSINLYNSIGATSNNLIAINSSNSLIDGDKFNTIIGTNNSYIKPYSTEQSAYSVVLGGIYGKIKRGVNSFVIGGNNNSLIQTLDSGIIGGNNNVLSSGLVGSVIVGGKNITLNQSYTVAVPELRVSTLPVDVGSIIVADTNGYLKKSNLSVSNLVYSVLPGINTFTAGTANNPTINVTALTINTLVASGSSRFTTLSATTFSAGTIYSASTNLDQIFHLKSGYLLQKNGLVSGSTFAGSPLTANVVFTSSFSNNNYIITITGEDARMWSISSKSVAGFTINSNSSIAITGNVFWMASENGEGYR